LLPQSYILSCVCQLSSPCVLLFCRPVPSKRWTTDDNTFFRIGGALRVCQNPQRHKDDASAHILFLMAGSGKGASPERKSGGSSPAVEFSRDDPSISPNLITRHPSMAFSDRTWPIRNNCGFPPLLVPSVAGSATSWDHCPRLCALCMECHTEPLELLDTDLLELGLTTYTTVNGDVGCQDDLSLAVPAAWLTGASPLGDTRQSSISERVVKERWRVMSLTVHLP
jgi:hypothetical protein